MFVARKKVIQIQEEKKSSVVIENKIVKRRKNGLFSAAQTFGLEKLHSTQTE